jgi:hypothetical protein
MGENGDDAMCCFPPWERSRKEEVKDAMERAPE